MILKCPKCDYEMDSKVSVFSTCPNHPDVECVNPRLKNFRGLDEVPFERFLKIAQKIRSLGIEVCNPTEPGCCNSCMQSFLHLWDELLETPAAIPTPTPGMINLDEEIPF